jgi:hypothetical protein
LPEYASICRHSSAARSEVASSIDQAIAGRRDRGQLVQRQAGVSQNNRQQVVEIVGDAAGQHAQAFQFLGLLHLALQLQALFLRPLALGDIGDRQKQQGHAVG